ncbi:MAG: molybdenum cofactor biosynthesis protein [Phycisphaera sp.]|nr:molybdenum cofactor biosynthesis protein [Phycisphaera sp.]
MNRPPTVAVLTVSDRCFNGEATDTSGPALCDIVRVELNADVIKTHCVPDEQEHIADELLHWATVEPRPDLILTTGGTGLAPRDVTPEATKQVIQRDHPGLIQLMQLRCYEKTPRTFLSRGVAGAIDRTLIINLPGSKRGAVESLEAILDILPHAIDILRGDPGDHAR